MSFLITALFLFGSAFSFANFKYPTPAGFTTNLDEGNKHKLYMSFSGDTMKKLKKSYQFKGIGRTLCQNLKRNNPPPRMTVRHATLRYTTYELVAYTSLGNFSPKDKQQYSLVCVFGWINRTHILKTKLFVWGGKDILRDSPKYYPIF